MTNNEYRGRPDHHIFHSRLVGTVAHSADITSTPAPLDLGGLLANAGNTVLRQKGVTRDDANDRLTIKKKAWYRVRIHALMNVASTNWAANEEITFELQKNGAALSPAKKGKSIVTDTAGTADLARANILLETTLFLADEDTIRIMASTTTTTISAANAVFTELEIEVVEVD